MLESAVLETSLDRLSRPALVRCRVVPIPTAPPAGNASDRNLASAFVSRNTSRPDHSEYTGREKTRQQSAASLHVSHARAPLTRYHQSFNAPAWTIRTRRRVRGFTTAEGSD